MINSRTANNATKKENENMKYFTNCKTLEELKATYKKLALKNHPDVAGGSEETMKAINKEYDEVFPRLKNIHTNKDGEQYTKENNETPNEFKDIITAILRMEFVTVEVIGSFLWVSGNTKPYRDELKKLGFKWHQTKACWYKSPEGYRKYGKKSYSMDEIKEMYGVQYSETGKDETRKLA